MVDDTIPLISGTAIAASDSALVLQRIGTRPAMMATTVIILGQTRSPAQVDSFHRNALGCEVEVSNCESVRVGSSTQKRGGRTEDRVSSLSTGQPSKRAGKVGQTFPKSSAPTFRPAALRAATVRIPVAVLNAAPFGAAFFSPMPGTCGEQRSCRQGEKIRTSLRAHPEEDFGSNAAEYASPASGSYQDEVRHRTAMRASSGRRPRDSRRSDVD